MVIATTPKGAIAWKGSFTSEKIENRNYNAFHSNSDDALINRDNLRLAYPFTWFDACDTAIGTPVQTVFNSAEPRAIVVTNPGGTMYPTQAYRRIQVCHAIDPPWPESMVKISQEAKAFTGIFADSPPFGGTSLLTSTKQRCNS
jgi:hypothetical protein